MVLPVPPELRIDIILSNSGSTVPEPNCILVQSYKILVLILDS